ncbi:MAG: orotate phosphoribosyltransferase [Ruminococcaceae bacterium]|nr:orotate phosphoribosyltransferase [Oscillospiraceae bacterium]
MKLGELIEITSANNPNIRLRVYRGHFATSHSHMNYYIDVAANKASLKQTREIARELADRYRLSAEVDTILCLDGSEVIGAFIADRLAKPDYYGINADKDISVLTPERINGSQLFFRDNTAPMLDGKKVLILAVSIVTGYTAQSAVEAVRYYNGMPVGICSIFSNLEDCVGIPVNSVFGADDLPGYESHLSIHCPMCKEGEKITALVNSFGVSAI